MQPRTVTVGPNASSNTDSQWFRLDDWAGGQITFQCVVSGTVGYSVLTTNDDPNSPTNPVAAPTWDSALTGVSGATANSYGTLSGIPTFIKVNLASGTGSVAMTVTQSLNAPF
jgi:hypothetical protein